MKYDSRYFEGVLGQGEARSPRNRKRLALILAEKPGRLLEVGCGPGHFLRTAAPYFQVEGLDISNYAVGALDDLPQARIKQADIEEHSLPRGRYNVVAAFNLLEHLASPAKVVAELYQTLHPGGLLVGSVPHNRGFIGRAHTLFANLVDRTHCSTYTPVRWRQLFYSVGFTNIDFFGEVMCGKRFGWYLRGTSWHRWAFNLVFLCRKPASGLK